MTGFHFLLCHRQKQGLTSVQAQHRTNTEGDRAGGKNATCSRTRGPGGGKEPRFRRGLVIRQNGEPKCYICISPSAPPRFQMPHFWTSLSTRDRLSCHPLTTRNMAAAMVTIHWSSCPQHEVGASENAEARSMTV